MIPRITILDDYTRCKTSTAGLGEELRQAFKRFNGSDAAIQTVNIPELGNGGLMPDNTDVFYLPGIIGETSYYYDHIQAPQQKAITGFLDHGGTVIGNCAGAYYFCRDIEYERGDIKKRRTSPLPLFNGTAKGPVELYGRESRVDDRMSDCTSIPVRHWSRQTQSYKFSVCYGNGAAFIPDKTEMPHITCHTFYDTPTNRHACLVSKDFPSGGRLILMGIVPQYGMTNMPDNDPLRLSLAPHETSRQRLLTDVAAISLRGRGLIPA